MGMPSDVGIIDCMIGFAASDFSQYEFIRKQLKDAQSKDGYDFSVPLGAWGQCPYSDLEPKRRLKCLSPDPICALRVTRAQPHTQADGQQNG